MRDARRQGACNTCCVALTCALRSPEATVQKGGFGRLACLGVNDCYDSAMRCTAIALVVSLAAFLAGSCGSSGGSALPDGARIDQGTTPTVGSGLRPFGEVNVAGRVVEIGQTFTVGITGHLVALEYVVGGADSELVVRVMPAPGGVIDPFPSNALATVTIAEAYVRAPGFASFLRLADPGIPVTAGDELALVFSHPDGRGSFVDDSQGALANGRLFERDNQGLPWTPSSLSGDLVFATYVAP